MALGVNQIAALAGQFLGLVAGGLLAERATGARCSGSTCRSASFGTIWSYRKLRDDRRAPPGADRLVGQRHLRRRAGRDPGRDHHGIQPYGGHATGWHNPVGARRAHRRASLLLVAFVRHRDPRRRADVRPRACSGSARSPPATSAALLAAIARGGLQFMLIIWLQGIWLPLHGYDFDRHAAVGGHLPAAADRRLPGRRPGVGLPVRPLRRARLRDRRHARVRPRASSG